MLKAARRRVVPAALAVVLLGSLLPGSAMAATEQVITFTSSAPAAVVVGDPGYTPAATASSGLPVVFSVDPGSSSVCSLQGADIRWDHVGACVVNADQGGDADWSPAPQVQQVVSVGKGSQVVAFTTTAPSAPSIGDTYVPAATGGASGNPVVISIDASSSAICHINAGTVTFDEAGACAVNADQAGNADWEAAPRAQQVVDVANAAPVCTPAAVTAVMNTALAGSPSCEDLENDPLVYGIAVQAAHGTAAVGPGATWTYTSDATYTGPDSFAFTAHDGTQASAPATVSIEVVNRPVDASNFIASVPATVTTLLSWKGASSAGAGDTGQPLVLSGVGQGSKGRLTTDGTELSFDPRRCATGIDTPTYSISDGLTTDTATAVVSILRPGAGGLSSAPLTDVPSIGLKKGGTLGRSVPVRVRWCGVVRSGSSVKAYRVQQSTDGGATWPVLVARATSATSATLSIARSKTYAWRVRTTDNALRRGRYRVSATANVSVRQEAPSAAVVYAGAWRTTTSSRASGGTLRSAASTSASVTVTVAAGTRQVGIVGPKGSGAGSFRVWVDGTYAGSFTERASTASFRRIQFVRSLDPGVGHTIVLKPAGDGRVYLDAIVSLR